MTFHLTPFHIFKTEITRLNKLYWTSKYAYSRTIAILSVISSTGTNQPDPRVDTIWASKDTGEASNISLPLSDFVHQLSSNESALRFTAILHMCSAFETALANYYALCALYKPDRINNSQNEKVPGVLKSSTKYETFRKWAINKASQNLGGAYTKRLTTISSTFGIPTLVAESNVMLNDYYDRRHLIAHDQSLTAADAPDMSADEVIGSQLSVDETTWKNMINEFQVALEELDLAVQNHVVDDKGLALGIYRIITRDREMPIKELRGKLLVERKIRIVSTDLIKNTAEAIGFKTKAASKKDKLLIYP